MTTLEITLIIIGVVFLIGSFMVNDKLSHKDLDKIANMSAEELKIITEKEVTAAKKDLSDALDEEITQKQDETKRILEKEANSKIMAINEYSDTVLDSINKAHNEIMFLYSMLNDKHTELTELASHLQHFSDEVKNTETEALENWSAVASELEQKATVIPKTEENITEQAVVEQTVPKQELHEEEKMDDANHNEKILMLCRQGMSDVEIARTLGLGLGEVRLVIGLYKGEQTSEV